MREHGIGLGTSLPVVFLRHRFGVVFLKKSGKNIFGSLRVNLLAIQICKNIALLQFFLLLKNDLDISIQLKAGVRLKPVFPPRNLGLMPIYRSRFKHSQNPLFIPQSYV